MRLAKRYHKLLLLISGVFTLLAGPAFAEKNLCLKVLATQIDQIESVASQWGNIPLYRGIPIYPEDIPDLPQYRAVRQKYSSNYTNLVLSVGKKLKNDPQALSVAKELEAAADQIAERAADKSINVSIEASGRHAYYSEIRQALEGKLGAHASTPH